MSHRCQLPPATAAVGLCYTLCLQQNDLCAPLPLCSVEFGTIMLWFYIADRSTLLFPVEKEYIRDRFAFIFATLVGDSGTAFYLHCTTD